MSKAKKKTARRSASVLFHFRMPRSMLADWRRTVKRNGGNASACAVSALSLYIERERARDAGAAAIVSPLPLNPL